MNKKKKNNINDSLIDNDDYFYRDSEMYRANLDEPKHEIDPTFNIDKSVLPNKTVKIKK